METNNVPKIIESKDPQKQFLKLLELNPKNASSFLNLLLAEFVSNAGTLPKKNLSQNLFCNNEFEIDVFLYYRLARLFQQEIDMENIKYILKNKMEAGEVGKVIDSISFLETEEKIIQKEKDLLAKKAFDYCVKEVITKQEIEEGMKQIQTEFFKKKLPNLI